MTLRGLLVLWTAALFGGAAGRGNAAESAGPVPLAFEEFMGGTGGSAEKLVRAAVERSGRFSLTAAAGTPGPWIVRASSSAGRIDGALVTGDGRVVFSRHYSGNDLRDNVNAFADDLLYAVTGDRGIALSRLAFVSDKSGFREIYICDSDGQRIQQITRDRSISVCPSLGPGALLMTHTSYISGFPDVYVTNLSDGERDRVISAPGTNSGAAFSFDGARLALTMTHEGDPEIYLTTVTGARSRRLTESRSIEFSPAWAPDGERIVFCSDATGSPQLYVVPRRGGEPERLATGMARCTDPDWSADGHLIAFTSWQGSAKSVAVYELESGRTRTVLSGASDPCWGPDARHLAAVQSDNLIVLDVTTGKKDVIVAGLGKISEPSWSR